MINITSDKYLSDISSISILTTGESSQSILFKICKDDIKTILKLMPLQLPHKYATIMKQSKLTLLQIEQYIEPLTYASFFREAWLCCFVQENLRRYTPCFVNTYNCYLMKGLPASSIDYLRDLIECYNDNHVDLLFMKEWIIALNNPKADTQIADKIYRSIFGAIDMEEIDGTMDDLVIKGKSLDLSLIFEYLYTKIIVAFVGRIIFVDDHFGNIGYVTVDYAREYNIKCDGISYKFSMTGDKMLKIIDLEGYIFNRSQSDVFTVVALLDPSGNYWDKSIYQFLSDKVSEASFADPKEYEIMLKIFNDRDFGNIKSFPKIMNEYMPDRYRKDPISESVRYDIDLDDNSLRVITLDQVLRNN